MNYEISVSDLDKYVKACSNAEYQVITSGFITNRDEIVYMGLSDVFERELKSNGYLSLMFSDAFISGSALKGFKRNFSMNLMPRLIN